MMKYSQIKIFVCVLLTFISGLAIGQNANNITINTIVQDKSGMPIEGASILNDTNDTLAITNSSGKFSLEVELRTQLLVSAPGYLTKTFIATKDLKTIILQKDNKLINVAFRNVNEENLPVGVSNVDVANIFERSFTTYGFDGLEAFVPGYNGNNLWGMNSALVLVDGVPRDITSLMPSEIDQITFLKSASAVALYGSRGAKGVILVSTKRGDDNSNQKINVRTNAGINTPKRFPGYLGSSEYMTLYNEARVNDGLSKLYTDETIYNHSGVDPYRYPSVDFYSSEYLKSSYNRYDMTTEIYGGNDKAKYYTNIGYNSTGSLLNFGEATNNNTADRFNIRGNVNMKLNNMIRARIDASAVFFNQGGVNTDYWANAAALRPDRLAPLIPLSLIEPTDEASFAFINSSNNIIGGKYLLGGTQLDQTNPFATIYAGGSNNAVGRQFQFTTGVDADLQGILSGLTFSSSLGIDYSSNYNQGYRNGYATYQPSWTKYSGSNLVAGLTRFGQDTKSGNQIIDDSRYGQTISLSSQLNYNKTVNLKHNFSAILMGTGFTQSFSEVYQRTTNSNLGLQVGYDFKQKYFVELTGSMVSSPRLAEGKRSAFSPAGSIAWVISEESFLKDVKFLNRLKLNASAGILYTDLDFNDYFLYEAIYSQSTGTFYSWNDGILVRTTDSRRGSNPDLKMARREEFTVGFDGAMFNNSVTFGANYFKNTITGNIIQSNVLYPNYFTTGFPNSSFIPYVNFNEDQRSGFDFNLNFIKRSASVSWNVGTVVSYYSTKATKRAENFQYSYQLREGKPLDALFGLRSNGFYNSTEEATAANTKNGAPQPAFGQVKAGDIKYVDVNEDGLINDQDQVYLGKGGFFGAPLTTGLNLTAKWKNLTFFALATGRFGASAIKGNSGNAAQRDYFWVNGEDKYSAVVRNRWTEATKETATFPRLTTTGGDNNFRNSDFWMYNTDRIDLSKVQLSYTLTGKALKSKFLKEMGFYASGFNLLTASKERALLEMNLGGAPQTRFYNLGIKATF